MPRPSPSVPVEPPQSVPPDLVGSELSGRYRIESRLGAGGFGVVYRAFDEQRACEVAIKVLREELGASKSLKRRFEREARALKALSHPNIVRVTDYGVVDGMPYLAMELLRGRPLDQELKESGPLSEARAAFVMSELLAGIGYMHARGLVHRDLKPGNVFVQQLPNGRECIKLLDFGLAKFLQAEGDSDLTALTKTGQVFGTPAFMPPEQLGGSQVDQRGDLYSAAVVLYQMLSGQRPFAGEPHEVLRKVLVATPPTLESACPDQVVAPQLEAWFQRALAKDPEARLDSAEALLAALEAIPRPWLRNVDDVTTHAVEDSIVSADTIEEDVGERFAAQARAAAVGRRPGRVARLSAFLRGFLRRVVVASAALISLASILVIAAAAAVIYLLSSDGAEPSWLPADIGASSLALDEAAPEAVRGAGAPVGPRPSGPGEGQDPRDTTPVTVAAHGADAPVTDLATPPEMTRDDPDDAPEAEAVADSQAGERADGAATGRRTSGEQPGTTTTPGEDASGEDVPGQDASGEDAPGQDASGEDTSRPRARDPFRRGTPRPLVHIRKRLARGYAGNERMVKALRRYNRKHPRDARGHLLLARLYMNRHWYGDVVTQYGFAHGRDPLARGDRHMLRHLIRLVGEDSAHVAAARLVRTAYGKEALGAVQRTEQRAKEAKVKRRLARLGRRLGATP